MKRRSKDTGKQFHSIIIRDNKSFPLDFHKTKAIQIIKKYQWRFEQKNLKQFIAIFQLAKQSNIIKLLIEKLQIGNQIFNYLTLVYMPQLITLNIADDSITSIQKLQLMEFPKLKTLQLSGNFYSVFSFRKITNAPYLDTIVLNPKQQYLQDPQYFNQWQSSNQIQIRTYLKWDGKCYFIQPYWFVKSQFTYVHCGAQFRITQENKKSHLSDVINKKYQYKYRQFYNSHRIKAV